MNHRYTDPRGQISLHLPEKLLVDNFAGGGGASTGVEMAFGRPVDIAINHDRDAIAMHAMNHPYTTHYIESVWDVDPVEATQGSAIEWGHFSPDCTHHSKARGGKPRKQEIRGLAWIVIKWALLTDLENFSLENVEEFQEWGPLNEEGQPIKERAGETYRAFKAMLTTGIDANHPAVAELREFLPAGTDITNALQGMGYSLDGRELIASDYSTEPGSGVGIATTRKRYIMVGRKDGQPVQWPEQQHGPGLKPIAPAGDCIDWTIPAPSIFTRDKALVPNTLKRICRGFQKFVIEETPYKAPDAIIGSPAPGAVPVAFLVKNFGGNYKGAGINLNEPLHTITTKDHHAIVVAWLLKYYGTNTGTSLHDAMQTITTRDRFGLVLAKLDAHDYRLLDIGFRILAPHELYKAQGFPAWYIHDRTAAGKALSKSAQVRMVGNSVPPGMIAAVICANRPASAATTSKTAEAAA